MVSWDPQTYLGYAAERARPFHELLARVGATAPDRVVDLGCGPGGLTASLARRWPAARVVGVDSSPDMIAAASTSASQAGEDADPGDGWGRVDFRLGDVRDWRPERPVDVIVTNATLQWVTGHLELLPIWVERDLQPGGWLALQVPGNLSDRLHVILGDLVGSPRWAPLLTGTQDVRDGVVDPVRYVEILSEIGCTVDAWETTYVHVLDPEGRHGDDAVLQWAMGTALRPVLDALPDKEIREEFLAEYADLLRVAYPRRPWGTPLTFRRIFAVAHKREAD